MKAEDIIKALVARLPSLTNRFTSQTSIDTITSSALVATATVNAGHGLIAGELVTITDAISPISTASITRTLDKATVITSTDHDFTTSAREISKGVVQSAIISGSDQSEFNGSFTISSVTNRREFIINITDSGPTNSTGQSVVENASSPLQGYNGVFNVTVTSSTQFTYPLQDSIPNQAIGSPKMHNGHRISGAVTIDRFMDSYTVQNNNNLWLTVILGDVVASKGRENRSDSTDRFTDNQHYRQEITQPFGVYVVFPASTSISGRTQRDDAEDVVPFIMQSLLLESFPTGLSAGVQNRATFTAHGFYLYNGPQYVHEITFEQNADIIFDDSVGSSINVAFRDIELTINNDIGTGESPQTANIDLDTSPL